MSTDFFATCPKGLEYLLADELSTLGADSIKETVAGVYFTAPMSLAYKFCLWSRVANRLLLPLVSQVSCHNVEALYQIAKEQPWEQHLAVDGTFAIDFTGKLPGLRHSHFGALKVKDAIADYFTEHFGKRPDVDTDRPDLRVNVHIHKTHLTLSLNLSGESLHKRGYRLNGGRAPLKENLAAALLLRADWPGIAAKGGALIDPMCGSGTLLIEGALMAMGIAPGLARQHWGFTGWLGHDTKLWSEVLEEARLMQSQAMDRQWPEIRGYDASPGAISAAEENIESAGLTGKVRVLRKELAQFTRPTHKVIDSGLVITNPPYGERLGEESYLIHLYGHLGDRLKEHFSGWQAAVFTGNPELGKRIGLRSHKQYQFFNGAIPSKLLLIDVQSDYFVDRTIKPRESGEENVLSLEPLSKGAEMFANRLKKNIKQLEKWRKQNSIECYRIYDADMPEYSVAIDCYRDWVHVAEYKAPKKVDTTAAEKRLQEILSAIPTVLNVPAGKVVLKQRQQQKGRDQYRKKDSSNDLLEVVEGQARLLVNLKDYLDTGLFLDHRPVRLKIAELAAGKRFLNLFCYTATATVQAAVGKAKFTDSVDLSTTYLDWGRKNLSLNGFDETKHRLHRADCREWIKECQQRYDLILLDPPTFSNSKRMDGVLDIQRDHVELIRDSMKLLSEGGLLIFSTNQRQFKLDSEVLSDFSVEDKTRWSLDKDFQRSQKIHQCWFISHSDLSD
jgi:23S rRNA (guanine2445-N2)-methyltransferase / 23S rRNA (guanine2069-N7)-methyltransferase